MKTYTFYEIENGKKKYLKTFFNIAYRKYIGRYIDSKTNKEISAYINHTFILAPIQYERKEIFKLFINTQCTDGFSGLDLQEFSNDITEIKPNYQTDNYPSKEAPMEYINGFIYPEKYRQYNVFQFNIYETVKPYKREHYFKKGIDELIIENYLISAENRTVNYLNN